MTISRDGISQYSGDCQSGGLIFPRVPDVDAFYEKITAKGISTEGAPEDLENKMRDFRVRDPDGNTLNIFTEINSWFPEIIEVDWHKTLTLIVKGGKKSSQEYLKIEDTELNPKC